MKTVRERLIANLSTPEPFPFLRLLDGEGQYSYAEVMELSSGWSCFYLDKGLVSGNRVVIILKHSIELYVAFLGALLVNLVPVMFAFPSPKYSEQEYFKTIGSLLENSDSQLIITYPELKVKLLSYCDTLAEGFQGVYVPEDLPTTKHEIPTVNVTTAKEIAILQYSSGTTGLKKGVALSHQALLWQVDHYAEAIKLSTADTIVSWLPLYHDMGLIACFLMPFIRKVKLVAMSPFAWVQKPAMLLRSISDFQGTLCWLPNFAYSFMAKMIPETELQGLDLSSLRGMVNCSEPIMDESHESFVKRFSPFGLSPKVLCSSYAMAENTFAVTSGGFDKPLLKDIIDGREFIKSRQAVPVSLEKTNCRVMVSSGLALPETIIEIVSDDGKLLPDRQVGEIVLQSPCLLTEYYRNPEATNKAIQDGKYFTGDLGYTVDGELFVTGRKKDMIIIGGQNIYPQDIEFIVNEVPGIISGRNVALGLPDPSLGTEKLIILAETNEKKPEVLEQIKSNIYERVASQTEIVASDIRLYEYRWLLKSTSGKIARSANLERYLQENSHPTTHNIVTIDTDTQSIVRQCVKRELAQNLGTQINDDTPIITSGLINSFRLAGLITTLEQNCGVTIPTSVFLTPNRFDTIEDITEIIKQLKKNGSQQVLDAGIYSELPLNVPTGHGDIVMHGSAERKIRRANNGLWTWFYRWLFWRKGIRYGAGLNVRGPLILRLDGAPSHISIGNNVTLMPYVDLKIRENGKIILHDGVVLDTMARLVAANNARLELGEDVRIAMGTIINAGEDVLIGRRTATAGFCTIIASEHKYNSKEPFMKQGYNHSPVYIGEDVWLAANVFVGRGSRIGNGAIIGAKSVVTGDIPAYTVATGNPARVVKLRI